MRSIQQQHVMPRQHTARPGARSSVSGALGAVPATQQRTSRKSSAAATQRRTRNTVTGRQFGGRRTILSLRRYGWSRRWRALRWRVAEWVRAARNSWASLRYHHTDRRGSVISLVPRIAYGLGGDAPLQVAVLCFAIIAAGAALRVGDESTLFLRTLGPVALPDRSGTVLRAGFRPIDDDFAVIGEIREVDPAQFARLEVASYQIQPGDTLGEIAAQFDLRLDTLISFNQIEDVRRIQVGDQYQIPNRDGLLYTVKRGDSLASIASAQNSSVNALLDANDLRSQTIQEGQVLFVPGAQLNETELRIILGELFAWPTTGRFTSGFGMRSDPFTGVRRFHNGIDLASSIGTPIRAAASGTVIHVESQVGNYGRFVIVRHPGGFQTLYAHLETFNVRVGNYVQRGQMVGRMGNTGRSTGPHLHFSVIHNGTFVDPLRYLR